MYNTLEHTIKSGYLTSFGVESEAMSFALYLASSETLELADGIPKLNSEFVTLTKYPNYFSQLLIKLF